MFYEEIDLYDYFKISRAGHAGGRLRAYAPEKMTEIKEKLRPAMLVIPGGGYQMISQREKEPVALRFLNYGFASFALEYSVQTAYPTPLIEAGMAMAYIRLNAARYCADAKKVAAVGFSAGGHLTGMLATLFEDAHLKDRLGKNASLVRPDAVIFSYAVITTGKKTHGGSADVISGGDGALRAALSIETRVTEHTPPAFIWHTFEDDAVPVENAILAANAYRAKGVPFELHIFEKGWHGESVVSREVNDSPLPEEIRRNEAWIPLAVGWLKTRGFTVGEK